MYGPALFATALPGLLFFTVGIVLFGLAVARSTLLPKTTGYSFALSGVLFGLIGFAVSEVQTLGAALMILSTVWIVVAHYRRGAREIALQPTESSAPQTV